MFKALKIWLIIFQNLNSPIKFVYVSTACVFDGHSGMYDEDDIPYPENFYALTNF